MTDLESPENCSLFRPPGNSAPNNDKGMEKISWIQIKRKAKADCYTVTRDQNFDSINEIKNKVRLEIQGGLEGDVLL